MATRKRQLNFACLGIDEINRRPLVSAIGVTSSRLGVEFHWSEPAQAQICIIKQQQAERIRVEAVVIRYGDTPACQGADLVRPVRVSQLMQALQQAVDELDRRQAAAAAQGRPRRYRGQIIEDAAPRAEPSSTTASRTVVYRGARLSSA